MNFQQLSALRPDLAFIAHWINPRTKVLIWAAVMA